ncbi:MAG: hypothetical protein QOD67_4832 [Caballeronia sp.]|jgi:hypothetical protein|nr:hypothetical protein [Caballeronia sp.]
MSYIPVPGVRNYFGHYTILRFAKEVSKKDESVDG